MIDTFMLMHFHQAVLFQPLSHRRNRQQVLRSIIISGAGFHVLIVIKLESQLRGPNVYLIEQHSLLEDLPANLFIASQVSVPSTPPFLSYLSVHPYLTFM
jgi:hypothetical protein